MNANALEYMKNDTAKDWMGDLKHLKLLKYTYKGKIKSEKDKYSVIEATYSDKAPAVSMLPNLVISDTTYTETDMTIHQKIYPQFKIVTVRQMVDAGKLTEDSIAMLKTTTLRKYRNWIRICGIGLALQRAEIQHTGYHNE